MRSSCQHCAGVYNSISGIIRPVGSGGWDITACGWAIGSRSTNLADKLRGKHSVGLATAPVNEVWADNTSLPSPGRLSSCLLLSPTVHRYFVPGVVWGVWGGEFTLCYFYGSFVRNWVATFEGSDLEMGSEKEYERF